MIFLLLPFTNMAKRNSSIPDSTARKILMDCGCIEDSSALTSYLGNRKEHPKRIWLDFRTKEIFFEDKYLSPKEAVQVIVVHINNRLFDVKMVHADSMNLTPVSASGTLLPTLFSKNGITGLAQKLAGKVGPVPAVLKANAHIKASTAKGVLYQYRRVLIRKALAGAEEKEAKTKKISSADSIRQLQQVQSALIDSVSKRIGNAEEMTAGLLFSYRKTLLQLDELYTGGSGTLIPSPADIHSDLGSGRREFRAILRILKRDSTFYAGELEPYTDALESDTNSALREAHYLISTFYDEAIDAVEGALQTISPGAEDTLITRLHTLSQTESCYKSLPLFFAKDTKRIDLSIVPRGKDATIPQYMTTFSLPWLASRIYGVSSGFYIDGLRNENPVVVTKDTGKAQTFSLEEDKGSGVGMGISAQAYFGWRIGWFGGAKADYLALAFGGGLSIEAVPKPRVMLGAAFVSGYNRRFIISTGVTAGHVSRTSVLFKDQNFPKAPEDYSRDVIKASVYLSISYSILGGQ